MTRTAHRLLYAALAAALLGGAGLAQAAGTPKVRCEVTESGKKVIEHVATREACTKMHGTVVHAQAPKK